MEHEPIGFSMERRIVKLLFMTFLRRFMNDEQYELTFID